MEQGLEATRFRRFEPGDMDAVTRLAWDAWALGGDEGEGEEEAADPRVMEGYVSSFLMRSNYAEVALDSRGIVGVMFGRIKGLSRDGAGAGSVVKELGLVPRFLFDSYGTSRIAPTVVWHFFMTEFKVLVNKPRSDAEVNLIIVDSSHRGKGMGRALMDRFIASAKGTGARSVTLYTDDKVSNWKFYEVLGFRKVATFHDGLTSYFAETDANAIVYELRLV